MLLKSIKVGSFHLFFAVGSEEGWLWHFSDGRRTQTTYLGFARYETEYSASYALTFLSLRVGCLFLRK